MLQRISVHFEMDHQHAVPGGNKQRLATARQHSLPGRLTWRAGALADARIGNDLVHVNVTNTRPRNPVPPAMTIRCWLRFMAVPKRHGGYCVPRDENVGNRECRAKQ